MKKRCLKLYLNGFFFVSVKQISLHFDSFVVLIWNQWFLLFLRFIFLVQIYTRINNSQQATGCKELITNGTRCYCEITSFAAKYREREKERTNLSLSLQFMINLVEKLQSSIYWYILIEKDSPKWDNRKTFKFNSSRSSRSPLVLVKRKFYFEFLCFFNFDKWYMNKMSQHAH